MARTRRKGTFASAPTGPARDTGPSTDGVPKPDTFSIVANRGHGVAETATVDFRPLMEVPLIANNLAVIRRDILAGKTGGSLKNFMGKLRRIKNYCLAYGEEFATIPASAAEVDENFCHGIVGWASKTIESEEQKSKTITFFRRLMTTVGVADELLPSNPFDKGSKTNSREVLTREDAIRILNLAKHDAQVVISRMAEAKALSVGGTDPRRASGARQGSWSMPENRVWIMINVFRLRIRTFAEIAATGGLNGEMNGIMRYPGARYVAKDGEVKRHMGWSGHLRWFYPFNSDMSPFVALILLRTGWNLDTVACLRSGRWQEPYPFKVGETSNETHVYIVSYKTRGRNDEWDPSKVIKFPSSRKPWSHPYRILSFVEELTRPLREEIHRRISDLTSIFGRSTDEEQELSHLHEIKDDLFIYKTEQNITSLTRETRGSNGPAKWLLPWLERAGLKGSVRLLRDAKILFSYEVSGQNLFVAQLIADHSSGETTGLYLRRNATIEREWDRAIDVFGKSLELIEAGEYNVARLRLMLSRQGFDEQQVQNLLDPGNTTRHGNRCASPRDPPREFAYGTTRGAVCVEQDCIGGCPHARWFRDSIVHVARNLLVAENLRDQLGVESTEGSSLESRIARCRELLARWPAADVEAALAVAKSQLAGSVDLFLGAA